MTAALNYVGFCVALASRGATTCAHGQVSVLTVQGKKIVLGKGKSAKFRELTLRGLTLRGPLFLPKAALT